MGFHAITGEYAARKGRGGKSHPDPLDPRVHAELGCFVLSSSDPNRDVSAL